MNTDTGGGGFYRLVFYVPPDHAENVKNAIFAAGAGRIGAYSNCCWQTSGTGQFMPLEGSNPFIGSAGGLETVAELKIETVCQPKNIDAVIAVLREVHPYETPAFQYWLVQG